MKSYLTFQPTEVNWLNALPEGWEVKRLKYISNTRVSNVDKKSEDEIQVKLCNYTDVYKNDLINEKIEFMVATATRRQIDSFQLKKGDVIITKDSETPDDIGIPAYVDLEDTENIVCGYHLAISTPIDSVLLGKYLFRLFQSNIYRAYFEVSSNGITRYGLGSHSIYNTKILLPPYSEQCMIADFLDHKIGKINDLICKKQKLIELLKEERAAIINHAVTKGIDPNVEMKDTGIEWLGNIPKHWEIKKLKFVGKSITGLTYNPTDIVTEDQGILVLRSSNLQNGQIEFNDNVYVKSMIPDELYTREKDILICSRNGSRNLIGKNAIIGKEATMLTFGAFTTIYRSKFNNYIFYIFNSSLFSYQAGQFLTSTINQLTLGALNNFKIPFPPFNEQNKIVHFLDKEILRIDHMILKVQKEIDLLQEYRTALISEVVTGKIDVREEVVAWT